MSEFDFSNTAELKPLGSSHKSGGEPGGAPAPVPKKKRMAPEIRQIIVLAIVAVLIFAGVMIYLRASRLHIKTKLEDNPYIKSSVELTGYDGFGELADTATPLLKQVVDFDALYAAMTDQTKAAVSDAGIFDPDPSVETYQPNTAEGKLFYDCFSIGFPEDAKSDLLGNGDTLELELKVDTAKLNGLSMVTHKLSDKDTYTFEYPVKGLEEPQGVVDPFDGVEAVVVDTTDKNNIILQQKSKYKEKFGNLTVENKTSDTMDATGLIVSNKKGEDVNGLVFESDPYNGDETITLNATVFLDDDLTVHDKYLDFGDGMILYPLTKTFDAEIWMYLDSETASADKTLLQPIYAKAMEVADSTLTADCSALGCYLMVNPESGTSDVYYSVQYDSGGETQYGLVTVAGVKIDKEKNLADTDNYQYECVGGLVNADDISKGLTTTVATYKTEYDTDLELTELPM